MPTPCHTPAYKLSRLAANHANIDCLDTGLLKYAVKAVGVSLVGKCVEGLVKHGICCRATLMTALQYAAK